jgi:hypothetical protein
MRFAFVRCDTLPRLSWCAHLSLGSRVAHIYHGPWVETRDNWFVEGAWTGSFEQGGLDTALFLVGSGAVINEGRALFCTQSDMIERLYSVRAGRDLFLSNSMVFVLAMAGDEPDPHYPFYAHKMHWYGTSGIRSKDKSFPTRRGRRLRMHEYCQVAVGEDLRVIRVPKPVFPPPATFQEYMAMLRRVLADTLHNAASPFRRHQRYGALAMVSGGYDSNAVAALLSELGTREAINIHDQLPGADSGEDIARRLGITAHVYGRTDFRTAPGIDEAEFLASWPDKASDIVLAICAERLAGRVLTSGRHGDVMFGLDPSLSLDDFRTQRQGGGSRLLEFRLRLGFLNFSPLYSGGLHLSAVQRITKSEEMAPWRVGGDYDRPIARRILEEAGVPRGAFGVTKLKSAYFVFNSPADLSRTGREDFESYRRTMPRPGVGPLVLVKLRAARDRAVWVMKRIWWTAGEAANAWIPSLSWCRDWDEMAFTFHWGHARVQPRYAEAVTAARGGTRSPADTVGRA